MNATFAPKTMTLTEVFPVGLAGDSIWFRRGVESPESVEITGFKVEPAMYEGEYQGYSLITVAHNGPWQIYTDTEFPAVVTSIMRHHGLLAETDELHWTEQGMQQPGRASLETFCTVLED